MGIAMTVTSLIGTFIIGFSMLPQTIATFKTRQTANISLGLYFIMGVATLLITFYGFGLCVVPTDIQNIADSLSGNGPTINAEYIKNLPLKADVITGYIVPGAAIIFGELFCSVTSFMIAGVKLVNQYKAKKLNMTEAEYIESLNLNK